MRILVFILFFWAFASAAASPEFVKQRRVLVVGSNLLERTLSEKKQILELLNQFSQKRCFDCYKFDIPETPIGTSSQAILYLKQNAEAKKNTDIIIFDFNARALGAEYFDIQYQEGALSESGGKKVSFEDLNVVQRFLFTREFAHTLVLSSQKSREPLAGVLEIFFQNFDLLQDQIKETDQSRHVVVFLSNPWLHIGDISYRRNFIESFYMRRNFVFWILNFYSLEPFFRHRNFELQRTNFSFSDPTIYGQYVDAERPWLWQEKALKLWASEIVNQVDKNVR